MAQRAGSQAFILSAGRLPLAQKISRYVMDVATGHPGFGVPAATAACSKLDSTIQHLQTAS